MKFLQPHVTPNISANHEQAAEGNSLVAERAAKALSEVLDADENYERLLLRAAAGAGKSYVLKRLVREAVSHPNVTRVGVVAFTNRQTHPLARDLGLALGKSEVCLFVSKDREPELPSDVRQAVTVASSLDEIPQTASVVVGTIHKIRAYPTAKIISVLGHATNGKDPFDVLFVDEAWQVAHHLFDRLNYYSPIKVGVGDVGQLPPLEVGDNPWRGDPGYNPYRAWPTEWENGDPKTWVADLPAVWRPTSEQLELWRAFYPEWDELHAVAAVGDRTVTLGEMAELPGEIWGQVASGVPTLLEVEGLPEPTDPDVDIELIRVVEQLLDNLFDAGFELRAREFDDAGAPTSRETVAKPGDNPGDPLITILATRNQAVDDATDVVNRLRQKYSLSDRDIVSSTVDSWQGQTNGITVAIHPLSGADALDEFNSAFGRLAVTCTRATHGLLMVTRTGLDELLLDAPARSGTPLGEPGFRTLPRQTHSRILLTFARGTVNWANRPTTEETTNGQN
jgi:hypothetical protein